MDSLANKNNLTKTIIGSDKQLDSFSLIRAALDQRERQRSKIVHALSLISYRSYDIIGIEIEHVRTGTYGNERFAKGGITRTKQLEESPAKFTRGMHGKVKRDITGINKDKRNAKAARLRDRSRQRDRAWENVRRLLRLKKYRDSMRAGVPPTIIVESSKDREATAPEIDLRKSPIVGKNETGNCWRDERSARFPAAVPRDLHAFEMYVTRSPAERPKVKPR